MAKAGWKFRSMGTPHDFVIGVDQNCGRIFLEVNGLQAFVMSDKESVALAKKVLAANTAHTSGVKHGD